MTIGLATRAAWTDKSDEERQMITLERFLKNVDKCGSNGCWVWIPARGSGRYGNFWIRNKDWSTTKNGAHRFSFLTYKGPILGDVVRHTCDNPECVNPDHLLGGSFQDNTADMRTRGRIAVPQGEDRTQSKLTEAQVREIRLKVVRGRTKDLSAMFGVGIPNISGIMAGRVWPQLEWTADELENLARYRRRTQVVQGAVQVGSRALTDAQIEAIRDRRRAGERVKCLKTEFAVSQQLIEKIASGRLVPKASDTTMVLTDS